MISLQPAKTEEVVRIVQYNMRIRTPKPKGID